MVSARAVPVTQAARYAELAVATNFSFLRGASRARELVAQAVALGHHGMGVADRNTLAGVAQAHIALNDLQAEGKGKGFRLATGARLCFVDGAPEIIVYPASREGWARLCRLLTLGNRRASKGSCILRLDDLLADTQGLLLIAMPPADHALRAALPRLREAAPGALWLGAVMPRRGDDRRRLAELRALADHAGAPLLAVNDVLYHAPERRPLQDVLTCVREGVTIHEAGRLLEANAERHLKSPEEMARLFRDAPDAVAESAALLERVAFSVRDLKYEYPDEPVPPGKTAQGHLEDLAWSRARWRYPDGVPAKVETLLSQELALIDELGYARYFLTIHDIVRFAQDRGILCQGRGSAANSSVCYVLGITCVNPMESDLLFARFLSAARKEPPDIDVDFEHERREEVIQHIYERYGRERAGIAATVISYRSRSAIRDVGKAMGLTEDVTAALAGLTAWWDKEILPDRLVEAGLDPKDLNLRRAIALATMLKGFPRHLSQHVGGFVLARGRLDELVPIANAAMEDRTFIEWNKDDLEFLGLMKVDVLALGMLTCIRKAFALLKAKDGIDRDLDWPPAGDEAVYDMLCKGDSIGVFQVESRAQINMLPRLRPRKFYDLVIEVAIVRPGPIQGDMVHPYLKRRKAPESVTYPAPHPDHGPADELRGVLGRTLGVPLFQEQVMQLAIDAAKFSPDEANGLRRAMATFRHNGTIYQYEDKFVGGMIARGYDPDFARRCFEQAKGFGEYGFPESHAASFAKLVYVSSWLKRHHPAIFTCALLNAQPMGFYAPAQLVRCAQDHGVETRPIDVSVSVWDNGIETAADGADALRLGLRQIEGFREAWAARLVEARSDGLPELERLARRARLPRAAMEKLAEADAFRSLGLDRREALWRVRRIADDAALPLFAAADAHEYGAEPDADLPGMALSEHVVADYRTHRLSLKAHPVSFLRARLAREGVRSCAGTAALPDGARARCAGVVLIRQRPGKGNAIFMTLEDETGIVNVVIWARLIEAFRKTIVASRLALVEGVVQKSPEGVVHLMAERLVDRSAALATLDDDMAPPAAGPQRHPRNVRILPRSRDFH